MSLSRMVEIPRPFDRAQGRLQAKRKFVMPAHAVSRIGLPALDAMKDGGGNMPLVSGGSSRPLNIAFHGSGEYFAKKWLASQDGEAFVVDLVTRNAWRFKS